MPSPTWHFISCLNNLQVSSTPVVLYQAWQTKVPPACTASPFQFHYPLLKRMQWRHKHYGMCQELHKDQGGSASMQGMTREAISSCDHAAIF